MVKKILVTPENKIFKDSLNTKDITNKTTHSQIPDQPLYEDLLYYQIKK